MQVFNKLLHHAETFKIVRCPNCREQVIIFMEEYPPDEKYSKIKCSSCNKSYTTGVSTCLRAGSVASILQHVSTQSLLKELMLRNEFKTLQD